MIIRLPKLLRHELASALFVGAGIWLFGILIKFPQGLLTTSHFPRLGDYLKLCANPFARDVNPVLAYRISVPVLAWALHLAPIRSEEHTSELQSHSDLVCRLLLEKKTT